MSILFALLPLLSTWYVSPLKVLRIDEDPKSTRGTKVWVFALILLFLFLFSYWLLQDALYAFTFVGATLLTFAILATVARGAMKLIKRYFPKRWSYTSRQGLLNLYRPNNQTIILILAIGLGTFLISTLYFTKDILLSKTKVDQTAENANIIILDVQSDQREAVADFITESQLPVISNTPLVTMRMHSIKGELVNDIRQDTTRQIRRWILNHEFRTTYRDTLTPSEELLEGEWISMAKPNEMIPISIAERLAGDARVTVGDTIVFNVQGVLMETKVGSIRKVDWGQLQINFNIVFPKGVLEKAPQFHVISTAAPDEQRSADLQRNLVSKFPNVSIIDLRQVFTLVENILDKVSWIINFMAFFSIITGCIVLIGSVRTSKYQRIKESVLLRTLGAKNTQILRIAALEYLFLGLMGSIVGLVLALGSSLGLALFLFQEPFVPSAIPFIVFIPSITLLVMAIGLSNIRTVLRSSPLEVLRREG
jgi:putative ABC transport system permease protein